MSTTDTKAEVKPIKPEVLAAAETLKKEIKFDGATGVGSITPDTYAKLMTEATGIEPATVEKLQKFNTTFVAAAHLANGQASLPVLKKHKDLESTELVIPMIGKDTFDLSFTRSKEVPNGDRENPGRKTSYGISQGGFSIHANGNRGELAKVKDQLKGEAAKLFS